ncbi:MAG: hypothetical protein GY804_07190 [Alphaproteobacteria bacterium]|nr:hypothetical protein [Alphaproteobacteria bacterium]
MEMLRSFSFFGFSGRIVTIICWIIVLIIGAIFVVGLGCLGAYLFGFAEKGSDVFNFVNSVSDFIRAHT